MNSPKRMIVLLLAAVVILACGTALASDNPMAGVALKQTINFSQPTVVGGTLLPAGDYKITHEMQGNTHIMIFTEQGGQKLEAKAKCNLVPLEKKASQSQTRYTENAKNERVLMEMTFRGDTAKHVLEQ